MPKPSNRLLIVEDDLQLRGVLEAFLIRSGFEVAVASNGSEALEQMASSRPDLVVSDMEMPVMGGVALLASMRASEELREVPVIFISGQTAVSPPRDRDLFLLKPLHLDELLSSIRMFFGPLSV